MNIQSLSEEDPRSLGPYELLGRLGRGSQGIVFLARDPANDTQVSVKLLRADLGGDEAARLRFLQEVEAAKRVARFCTAQVLDADVAGTQPYIVSEYIPGQSLAEVIASDGPRTGGALDRIAINTATALGAIHHAGVVHRDFKAANVLLGPDGPVVIDFGVAKALGAVERHLTLTGQPIGTPPYMAPEQFKDDPVGPATDIFAWGATMVFAATGTLPFGDGSIASVMYRILNEDPDLGRLQGALRDVVATCLAKDPAARPTARQIVDRLMSSGNAPEPTTAGAPRAGNLMPGAGAAQYTIDPLHSVPMRQDPDRPSPPPAGRRRRIPRAALIAAAIVIVLGAGTAAGLRAFSSPTASAKGKDRGTSQTGSPGVRTLSGARGSTMTTLYKSYDDVSSGSLAPAGETAGIPYYKPVKGDWDWLGGDQRCQTIGGDGTTEGAICVSLLEGNSGDGITWYTPALTAYCETISTGADVQCVKVTGHFGLYSATGVQEAPKEYASCARSHGKPCSSGRNYFVDANGSSWMTVTTPAAHSCQSRGAKGTDCEIRPSAYAGVDIELPGTNKNVTLTASFPGLDAIGY